LARREDLNVNAPARFLQDRGGGFGAAYIAGVGQRLVVGEFKGKLSSLGVGATHKGCGKQADRYGCTYQGTSAVYGHKSSSGGCAELY
jgi:hypothetical protein